MVVTINVWTGTGRLTRDPEVKYVGQNNNVCIANFGLAVRRKFHKDNEPDTDFFEIRTIGKTAEFCEKYLKKGLKIEVHGRLEQSTWTTKEGEKRSTVRIVADDIDFGESKASAEASTASSEPKSAPEQPKKEEHKDMGFMDIPDGDMETLPFA